MKEGARIAMRVATGTFGERFEWKFGRVITVDTHGRWARKGAVLVQWDEGSPMRDYYDPTSLVEANPVDLLAELGR